MWRKFKLLWMLAGTLMPSRVRVFFMRRRGAVIGRGVWLGPLSMFECGKVIIGDGCRIGAFSRFKVRGVLEIGEDVKIGLFARLFAVEARIGAETVIGRNVTVAGAGHRAVVKMGQRCFIADECLIDLYCPVTLGEEVGIGRASSIYTHGSWQSELEGFPVAFAEVKVGDFAWLGAGVTVFAGAEIGEFACVAGGTVLRQRVPAGGLAVGNPGKLVLKNGAHLKPVSVEERFELCRQIIREAAAHPEWMGRQVEAEESAEHCRVTVDGRVLLFRRRVEKLEKVTAVISFERMSEALILEFEAAGTDWYDVERRRRSRPVTGMGPVIRSAFSDHGVRFQTTRRGEITGAPDAKRWRKPENEAA